MTLMLLSTYVDGQCMLTKVMYIWHYSRGFPKQNFCDKLQGNLDILCKVRRLNLERTCFAAILLYTARQLD